MNFDKRSYFRTKSEHPVVVTAIDSLHSILTGTVGQIDTIKRNTELSEVGRANKTRSAAEEARNGLDKFRGEITQREANMVDFKRRFKAPVLMPENTTGYLQAQEVRKWILEAYPQPELRERVLPELMAQNETILRAVSSCPLPEIRRSFVSDDAFNAGIDAWTRANNSPEDISYADRAQEIIEECLLNLQIAEQTVNQLCGVPIPKGAGGVLTRESFDALDPVAKAAHFTAGGTLSD